jgi:hypothetical protein
MQPMDFSTVLAQLVGYGTLKEFVAAMRLTFNNCLTFNRCVCTRLPFDHLNHLCLKHPHKDGDKKLNKKSPATTSTTHAHKRTRPCSCAPAQH